MDYTYGWEKLHQAIGSLTGAGSQKERLQQAITFSLSHITPENDLPLRYHPTVLSANFSTGGLTDRIRMAACRRITFL
jgi:hypothetical protein